jgi:Domain of unknown function (DUF5134)
MTPAWILDLLAAVMLVVAALSAARLVAARPWQRGSAVTDTDIAHLLMAIAMAGMLTTSLATLPDTAWEVIFGLLTAWFAVRVVLDAGVNGVRALAGGHCAPHLAHSAAMLYMFLAAAPATGSGGMDGMSGMSGMPASPGAAMTLGHPTIAFLFALILVGYSIWDLDQLSGRRYHRTVPAQAQALAGAGGLRVPAAAVPAAVAGASAATAPANGAPAVAAAGDTAGGGAPGDRGSDGPRALLLAPAVTVGCRVTMGVVMVFMLIIAI